MALLEDKKVDTSAVYDSQGGIITYSGKKVRDSHEGGYGKISLARGFEVSSNTVLVQAVYNNYKNNPAQFVDHHQQLWAQQTTWIAHSGRRQAVCSATVRQKSMERHFTPVDGIRLWCFYHAIANLNLLQCGCQSMAKWSNRNSFQKSRNGIKPSKNSTKK
jgi:hypothetical protein